MIFVSHSMPMVARICNQIILMENGKSDFQGHDNVKGISLYYGKFSNSETGVLFDDGSLKLESFIINNTHDKIQIKRGEDLSIQFDFTLLKEIQFAPRVYLEFRDKEQRAIAGSIVNEVVTQINSNTVQYNITIKNILFSLGLYSIDLSVADAISKTPLLRINNLITFYVESNNQMWVPMELESDCKIY
jgi:lipopolysaccharide transport system ATP-binding protein